MRIVTPKRGKKPARRLDPTELRSLLADKRIHVQLAVVVQPDGATKHWELVDGDIMVDVESVPRGLELRCHLGACAGALGIGLWRVPAVGTEVLVAVPDGQLDFSPVIVACLGGAPARASDERTVLVATDVIEITAPKVVIGSAPGSADPLRHGVVQGEAIDILTGLQQWQLGNTSLKVTVEK